MIGINVKSFCNFGLTNRSDLTMKKNKDFRLYDQFTGEIHVKALYESKLLLLLLLYFKQKCQIFACSGLTKVRI